MEQVSPLLTFRSSSSHAAASTYLQFDRNKLPLTVEEDKIKPRKHFSGSSLSFVGLFSLLSLNFLQKPYSRVINCPY